MQSARRPKYCSYGTAPELYHGEKISCRRYAIIQGKAERRLEQAEEDDTYATKEYYKDLERAKLYTDADRKMKF